MSNARIEASRYITTNDESALQSLRTHVGPPPSFHAWKAAKAESDDAQAIGADSRPCRPN